MAAQDDLRREAGAMKEEARAMWTDAADVARSAASQQQQAAAQGIGTFAGALREAARSADGGSGTSSRMAQTVADNLDRLSDSLKNRDLNSLLHDVEDFARRQPLVFFGAAVATGFLAMRFLKSSSPDGGAGYGDSALANPDAMQRGVGGKTRSGSHGDALASEFDRNAGVMASHDGEGTRGGASFSSGSAAGPRSDTARGTGAAPNVWPEANPVDKDSNGPGMQPRSDR